MTRRARTPTGTPIRAVGPTTATGDTHSNTTVDNLSVDVLAAGWTQGLSIVGNGIPDGTTIAALAAGGRSITISNAATASQAGVTLEALLSHQWVPIGPMVCARGDAKGQPRVSGRFQALAVSPDGQRVYAGSAMGGVWYSGDGGLRWKALDFYASTKDPAGAAFFSDALTVGAIGVKWGATANDDTVYVGAGEHPLTELKGKDNPEATIQGIGIRVATAPASTIGGATGAWADPWKLELTDLNEVLVNRIFVRQSDGAVWAATSRGLYNRPAGAAVGAAWRKINTGFGDTEIADVVVVMENVVPKVERVYAATPDGRAARSVDGGAWEAVNLPAFLVRKDDAAPAPGSVAAGRGVTRMRLTAGAELGRVVYALAEGPRLWRIDGDTASRVVGLPGDMFDAWKDKANREDSRPPYGMCLAVHPTSGAVAVGGEAYTPPAPPPAAGLKQAALFFAPLTAPAAVGGDWTFPAAAVAANLPRAEWAGAGVPVGVHALAWTAAANPSLWIAGKAGVFSSTNGAAPGSFVQRNSGLAAIESLALAQSSGSGSVLLLSTTGGAMERISGETWTLSLPGRTGGVAIDPARAYRMYAQVERSTWKKRDLELDRYESDRTLRGWQPLKFLPDPPSTLPPNDPARTAWNKALGEEAESSAPASRAALISTSSNGTQIAIGTDRIWYTDDFSTTSQPDVRTCRTTNASATIAIVERVGPDPLNVHKVGWRAGMSITGPGIVPDTTIVSIAVDGQSIVISNAANAAVAAVRLTVNERNPAWVTLPSRTNPFAGAAPNRQQDVLHPGEKEDRGVLMARWGSRDRLYVLTSMGVFLLERQVNNQWTRRQLYDQIAVKDATKWKTPAGQIPHTLALTSLEVRDATGPSGTLYVGTSGDPKEEHVWYYDGAQWLPTGLRGSVEDTPVHVVVVDPSNRTVVYAGTDAGVWKGVGVFPAAGAGAPTWTWTHFSTALPEAPCVDLAITTPADSTRRVLRAALSGRGVWEVALDDSVLQRPEVYLRAHDFDGRRELVSVGGPVNPLTGAGEELRLDASPDLRVWRRPSMPRPVGVVGPPDPAAPPPDVVALPLGPTSDPYDIWVLQSALRVGGEDIEPNGIWAPDLPAALDRRRVALGIAAAPAVPRALPVSPTPDMRPPIANPARNAARIAAIVANRQAIANAYRDYNAYSAQVGPWNAWQDALWQAALADNRLPFDRDPPDHADLVTHLRDEPDRWPKGARTSCVGNTRARVHLVVHTRHWRPCPPNTVRVALLRTRYGIAPSTPGELRYGDRRLQNIAPLPAGWAAEVTAGAVAAFQPVVGDAQTGDTHANTTIDNLSTDVTLAGWRVGWCIAGTGIPDYTTIVSIAADGLSITISRAVAGANVGVALTAGAWMYLATARPIDRELDLSNPQLATFDVDLSGDFWEKPGWLLMAVVFSADDPLTTAETDVGVLARTDHHVAVRSVRRSMLPAAPTERYSGMDAGDYPGLADMDQVWANSNLSFTAMYLDAPAPVLAAPLAEAWQDPPVAPAVVGRIIRGHHRFGNQNPANFPNNPAAPFLPAPPPGRRDPRFWVFPSEFALGSWMTAWNELHPSWGMLAIYWGHQDPGADNPHDLRLGIAEANAGDAAQKAADAGIPRGAVIYLDWEIGGNPSAAGVAYCLRFFRILSELGYRLGVYCHPPSSMRLREDLPQLFVWSANGVDFTFSQKPSDLRVERGRFFLEAPDLNAAGEARDRSALLRQWRFDLRYPPLAHQPAPPAPPPPPALAVEPALVVPAAPIAGFPRIDADASLVGDPAFPERRSRPWLIRRGPAAAAPRGTGGIMLYAIRAGRPNLIAWPPTPAAAIRPLLEPDHWWNPFSPMAAVNVAQLGGTLNPEHLLLALAYDQRDGDGVWRLHALQRPVLIRDWTHVTLSSDAVTIDPLPGVAATARGNLSIDGFVVDDVTGQIAACRWDPAKSAWSALAPLATAGRAAVTAPPVRRTNRVAAAGRDVGDADVFWVGSDAPINTGNDGLVYWTSSAAAAPAAWTAARQIGSATIRAHPLANLAATSLTPTRIDVLFMGRADTTTAWLLHDFFWDGATWRVISNVGNRVPAVALDPMSPIAVCRVDANTLDAFAVGLDDGALYWTQFTVAANAWSGLTLIGLGGPAGVRLASIDAAVSAMPSDRQVVATGRDGNVYATRWDSVAGAFTAPLGRITPLDV